MAKISVPIKIYGVDFAIRVIKHLADEAEFKDDVSEDYKNGFYDFSNAIITTLKKVKEDSEE